MKCYERLAVVVIYDAIARYTNPTHMQQGFHGEWARVIQQEAKLFLFSEEDHWKKQREFWFALAGVRNLDVKTLKERIHGRLSEEAGRNRRSEKRSHRCPARPSRGTRKRAGDPEAARPEAAQAKG